MTKWKELFSRASCFRRARWNEPIFVLRAWDATSPEAIDRWINMRVNRGLNRSHDKQIVGAAQLAQDMREWRKKNRPSVK